MKRRKLGWLTLGVFLATLAIYLFFCLSPVLFYESGAIRDAQNRLLITGHRGAAGLAPENTLAAVKKGLQSGADRIEIDVHQTRDSVIVVLHDLTLDRTTNGSGLVKDQLFEEIRKLHAGSPGDTLRIPTLDEVLAQVNGRATLCIEIKHGNAYYPGIERRVADLIRQHQAQAWTIIFSFEDEVLTEMHSIAPDLQLLKLFVAKFPGLPFGYDGSFRRLGLTDYPHVQEFGVYYYFANRSLLRQAHSLGKKVQVWTVNDPMYKRRLVNIGVDGIITDFPGD